jgi:hypothetical protein
MNDFQPLPLHIGELYVEQRTRDDFEHTPLTGLLFPARIPDIRSAVVRPVFRREVVEQISTWLAVVHQTSPDEVELCHFEGDTLVRHTRGDLGSRTETRPDADGLYPLDFDMTCWVLEAPSIPDSDAAILADQERLVPQPGECLVLMGWDGNEPLFPALVQDYRWNGWVIPRFRREVAEVVAAWINDIYRQHPEGCARAYWNGDVLVLMDSNCAGNFECPPEWIEPEDDGRYFIGAEGWTWELAPDPETLAARTPPHHRVGYAELRDRMELVIAEHGDNTVVWTDGTCHPPYFTPDGEPFTLLGHVLNGLGLAPDVIARLATVEDAHPRVMFAFASVPLTAAALDLADMVWRRDNTEAVPGNPGLPWSECVQQAEQQVRGDRVPQDAVSLADAERGQRPDGPPQLDQ